MAATKITVRNDGPLRIEGEIEILDMDGKAYGLAGRTAVALCRCGHSASKPFCDGSHKTAGFQDKQQARDLPRADLPGRLARDAAAVPGQRLRPEPGCVLVGRHRLGGQRALQEVVDR